jgi:hypothetical protein
MSSRNMRLLQWAALRSDSEKYTQCICVKFEYIYIYLFNPTLPGVPGNLFCLGKEIVRPRSPALCYRGLRFREFACNSALYD